MDRESMERLRFDRRLQRRRDGAAHAEYESYVEGLPDLSDKLVRVGDEREASEAAGEGSPGDAPESTGSPSSSGFGSEPGPSGSGERSTPA